MASKSTKFGAALLGAVQVGAPFALQNERLKVEQDREATLRSYQDKALAEDTRYHTESLQVERDRLASQERVSGAEATRKALEDLPVDENGFLNKSSGEAALINPMLYSMYQRGATRDMIDAARTKAIASLSAQPKYQMVNTEFGQVTMPVEGTGLDPSIFDMPGSPASRSSGGAPAQPAQRTVAPTAAEAPTAPIGGDSADPEYEARKQAFLASHPGARILGTPTTPRDTTQDKQAAQAAKSLVDASEELDRIRTAHPDFQPSSRWQHARGTANVVASDEFKAWDSAATKWILNLQALRGRGGSSGGTSEQSMSVMMDTYFERIGDGPENVASKDLTRLQDMREALARVINPDPTVKAAIAKIDEQIPAARERLKAFGAQPATPGAAPSTAPWQRNWNK